MHQQGGGVHIGHILDGGSLPGKVHPIALMKELAEQWAGAGIYQFVWSGTNGTRHRLLAADKLREELERIMAECPESEIILLAHSHGGNVVAWACTGVTETISAAVYLNTPFIQTLYLKPRLSTVLLCMISSIPFMFIAARIRHVSGFFYADHYNLFALGIVLGMLPFTLLLSFWSKGFLTRIGGGMSWYSTQNRRIARELVAVVMGDEVTATLGFVGMIQFLMRRLRPIVVAFMFFCLAMNLYLGVAQHRLKPVYLWLEIAALGGYCLVQFLVSTAGYGLVQGLIGVDSWIAITPSPEGVVDFRTVAWGYEDRLRHSRVYDSPEAIKAVKDWLMQSG